MNAYDEREVVAFTNDAIAANPPIRMRDIQRDATALPIPTPTRYIANIAEKAWTDGPSVRPSSRNHDVS